jgi:NAD+ diphosphatase
MTDQLPALARIALDRAAHHRTNQQWLDEAWLRAQILVIGPDNRALLGSDGDLVLLRSDQVTEPVDRFFLGVDETDVPYFGVAGTLAELPDAKPVHLWQVGHLLGDGDVQLFTSALALAQWHRSYRFSPVTGAPTVIEDAGWVRRAPDGEQVFPRTDPAVIVLVHDGRPGPDGQLLLGRNVMWKTTGELRYSVLAGFVELGESAEAAVVREVGEEVGVRVTDIQYVSSQSYPYPRSLMLGFTALADPNEPVRTDPTEIAHARWFTRREIAAVLDGSDTSITLPSSASIARHLIVRWMTP